MLSVELFDCLRICFRDALPRSLTRGEHLAAISQYKNLINVIRGSVSHLVSIAFLPGCVEKIMVSNDSDAVSHSIQNSTLCD